ncbi:unnamed protein product, partial [Allacma fusca]
ERTTEKKEPSNVCCDELRCQNPGGSERSFLSYQYSYYLLHCRKFLQVFTNPYGRGQSHQLHHDIYSLLRRIRTFRSNNGSPNVQSSPNKATTPVQIKVRNNVKLQMCCSVKTFFSTYIYIQQVIIVLYTTVNLQQAVSRLLVKDPKAQLQYIRLDEVSKEEPHNFREILQAQRKRTSSEI